MSSFTYGCESFSWSMSGKKYVGEMPHMCEVIKAAGLTGIETGPGMMAKYLEDSALMVDLLDEHSLQFASMGFGAPYNTAVPTDDQITGAERVFDYLQAFPNPRISLAHHSASRDNLKERQRDAMACMNEIARRGLDKGVSCSFHPSSYPTSLFIVQEDYDLMLSEMNPEVLTYCADSGHIVNGGMDIYDLFTTYSSLIKHMHFKDITTDKKWAAMGEGVIDFPRLIKILDEADYNGWIIFEEESQDAVVDPDAATLKNGRYLEEVILPLGY